MVNAEPWFTAFGSQMTTMLSQATLSLPSRGGITIRHRVKHHRRSKVRRLVRILVACAGARPTHRRSQQIHVTKWTHT